MDKCKICDNTFMRKYPRGGKRKIYCSKKCRYKDAYVEKKCITCGKIFTRNILYKKKSEEFCSLGCIQRYPCQLCGKIITGRITFQSGEKRFCSRNCSAFVHRTLGSKISYVPKGFAQSLKIYGKIMCALCRNEDLEVLCVHHLDKNRKNNDPKNLQTLCANCHHRIHFGKGKNRKKSFELAHLIIKHL